MGRIRNPQMIVFSFLSVSGFCLPGGRSLRVFGGNLLEDNLMENNLRRNQVYLVIEAADVSEDDGSGSRHQEHQAVLLRSSRGCPLCSCSVLFQLLGSDRAASDSSALRRSEFHQKRDPTRPPP